MPSSSGPANAQAHVLLRKLCKFILPFVQTALRQTREPKNINFGVEADEFIIELEKFISGTISGSHPRDQDVTIEAPLDNDSHSEEDKAIVRARSHTSERGLERTPTNQSIVQVHATGPQSMPLGTDEEDLGNKLQSLRRYVTQRMPIRLLCFEPQNAKLKISLLDRAGVLNHLAHKLGPASDTSQRNPIKTSYWDLARYAILSHTWTQTPGELTYGDWQNGSLDFTQPKCQKLINFCKAAWESHGLTLGWIDTVCINKESSAELDESIRSMYAWYENADVCITYLAGTRAIEEMHADPWFTRGWTLQELVAPARIKFYNKDWNVLSGDNKDRWDHSANSKGGWDRLRANKDKWDRLTASIQARGIQTEIELATTITADELHNFRRTSISRRMQLAAKRQVTREEDIAYCLMGIFDVSISTAYGEGVDRAYFRLLEEIFRSTKDVSDIFNWAGDRSFFGRDPTTSLFPSHPSNYLNRSKQLHQWNPIEPLTLTHLGLRIPILLMPAVALRESVSPSPVPIGDYHAIISVVPCGSNRYSQTLKLPEFYLLLDKRVSQSVEGMPSLAFGTLNVEEHGNNIHVPKTCLSVLLLQHGETPSLAYDKVDTKIPIVFDLKKIGKNSDVAANKHYYQIKRSQLGKHGMELTTLYL